MKNKTDETIVKFGVETKTTGNTAVVCLTEQALVNAQKIAAVLGELFVPEYPQVPATAAQGGGGLRRTCTRTSTARTTPFTRPTWWW